MSKMCPAPQQELERERLDKEGVGKREEKHYVNIQTTNKRQLRPGKDGRFVVQKDRPQPLQSQCQRKRAGWSEADLKNEHVISANQSKLNKTSNIYDAICLSLQGFLLLKCNALGNLISKFRLAKETPRALGAGK